MQLAMDTIREACLLLSLVVISTAAVGDAAFNCSETDATGVRDTLRQSVCRLAGNVTEAAEFEESLRAKLHYDGSLFFAFSQLFRFTTSSVWCRTTCPSPAPENITWCVNIASLDRDVETCIRPGSDQNIITESTCDAEVVGLSGYLSLPSDCTFYGGVGCLGLVDLDWFFNSAYLTCTVNTDNCSSTSLTKLITASGSGARFLKFEQFPSSPYKVVYGDSVVLHTEIITTTDRIIGYWKFGNTVYSNFIIEDPFCNEGIEVCYNDTHPDAHILRQERVRVYRILWSNNLEGCQPSFYYRLESYLIIDNATEQDGGEYTFNVTAMAARDPPSSLTQSVIVSIQPFSTDDTLRPFSTSVQVPNPTATTTAFPSLTSSIIPTSSALNETPTPSSNPPVVYMEATTDGSSASESPTTSSSSKNMNTNAFLYVCIIFHVFVMFMYM